MTRLTKIPPGCGQNREVQKHKLRPQTRWGALPSLAKPGVRSGTASRPPSKHKVNHHPKGSPYAQHTQKENYTGKKKLSQRSIRRSEPPFQRLGAFRGKGGSPKFPAYQSGKVDRETVNFTHSPKKRGKPPGRRSREGAGGCVT